MDKKDIQFLFKYNQWANAKILKAAQNVSQEQFLQSASYPHGGLRGTLTHLLSAEWIWRKRWQGESPTVRLKPEDFPTFESLQTRWQKEEKELMAYVKSLTNDELDEAFQYKTTTGDMMEDVLWQAMAHVVNHGTQHRSEAAAMLTDLGFSPGDIDVIIYLRER
ncbi:MAG: DinB family protein [Anaerolineales bacterium]